MPEEPETDELRMQIESIDEEIIDLIATRMEIADELAKAKRRSSEGYWNEEKEREVISRYHELCEEVSLSEDEARQIAEVILHISKERQKHYFERSCSLRRGRCASARVYGEPQRLQYHAYEAWDDGFRGIGQQHHAHGHGKPCVLPNA